MRTKKNLEHKDVNIQNTLIDQNLNSDLWSNGQSLHTILAKSMCEKKSISLKNRLEKTVLPWWNQIEKSDEYLSPDSIDLGWNNSILYQDKVCFIDREWIWNERVAPEWLILRTVSQFVAEELPYVHRWARAVRFTNEWTLMRTVATICGQKLSFKAFLKSI